MHVVNPFWKQFEEEQSKILEANMDRLKAALALLNVAHVNVHYTYRSSCDSGSGFASPVTMIKSDGCEIDIGNCWSSVSAPGVQQFKDAKVSLEEVWAKQEFAEYGKPAGLSIQRKETNVDILCAIERLPIVDTSLMNKHGSTHTQGEYDDEGGTIYSEVTEGKARFDAVTLKATPIDDLGNVIKIDTGFGRGRQ